jgi:hypothetical protein
MSVARTETDKTPDVPAAPPKAIYLLRVATAYLVVPHEHGAAKADVGWADRLKDALEADPRVVSATVPTLDPGWSPHMIAYPGMEDIDDDWGIIDGVRHVHVQRFSNPVGFHMHVPAKNQPKVFQDDVIPAEDYFVLWNGQSLIVAWRQDFGSPLSSSGGHIVESVLQEACNRIDATTRFQSCNPSCQFLFVHTDIVLIPDPNTTSWVHTPDPEDATTLLVRAPAAGDLEATARAAWRRYAQALRDFADMKNIGRRIMDLELVVRRDLDKLNGLHHRRAEAREHGVLRRVAAIWKFRSWRRQSRYYLARLWLALSSLEHMKRQWADERGHFTRTTREAGVESLFDLDASDEIDSVRELDLSLIEGALDHASARLDTSAVVSATVFGAIAGAIAAAIITLL